LPLSTFRFQKLADAPGPDFAPVVIRRLVPLAAFACCVISAPAAQEAQLTDFTADHLSYDYSTMETVATGNARVLDGSLLFTADKIIYNQKTDTLSALGRAAYTRGTERLLADKIVYHRPDGRFTAVNLRVGRNGVYIHGERAEGTREEMVIHNATIVYGEPSHWQPTVRADTIVYSPDHFIRVVHSWIGIGDTDLIPIPHLSQALTGPLALPDISVSPGYRSDLGAMLEMRLETQAEPGLKAGGELDAYSNRGFMFGPVGDYSSADGSGDVAGFLRSGFIDDLGKRGTDLLGEGIQKDRGFVEWNHQEELTDNLTLDGDVNWWSDSNVFRDFRIRSFEAMQEPDNFLESDYAGENFFASAFTRFQPDAFEPVQERLPELRFDLMPTAIGGGFYERFDAGTAALRELPPDGGVELKSNRLDAFYGLSRPISPASWFTLTPVAGARITDYFDTAGVADTGGDTRVLGELGFDAVLRMSGTFNYVNKLWKIDGLRHLFTPYVSYRYIPASGADPGKIPDIDADTFDTYLPPIELGDARAIDALGAADTLRVGIDNTLQTRDPVYGSRDLVVFRLAEDFLFDRQSGQPHHTDIYSEVSLFPVNWLEIDSQEIMDPKSGGLYEFESGIKLHDGDLWSVRLASDWVSREDDEYYAEWNQRLNEVYRGVARIDYDAREHRFDRREIGLIQNLNNTWRLEYTVTYDSGPSQTGHFGVNMQVDVVRF
jgi:LPS-assembly protein